MDDTGLIAAVGSGLAAAVGVLFKVMMAKDKEREERDRAQALKNAELHQKLGELQGRQDGISQLAEQALQAVAASSRCHFEPGETTTKDGGDKG